MSVTKALYTSDKWSRCHPVIRAIPRDVRWCYGDFSGQIELNRIVMGTKGAWTPERRAKQAAIIARTRPWEKATGPRTPEGKTISSRNADSGALQAATLWRNVQLAAQARSLQRAEWLLEQLQNVQCARDIATEASSG